MGKPSRDKGKRGELELAHELERLLGIEARRGRQVRSHLEPDRNLSPS